MQSGLTLSVGRPQVLFDFPIGINAGGYRQYDVTPDGRFIIIGRSQESANAPRNLILVQNWFEELKRLVPAL